MPSKREAYENLPPEPRDAFRAICVEWGKQFSKVPLASPEDEDKFIGFGGIHLTGVRRDPHQCSAADRHGRFAPGRSRLVGMPSPFGRLGGQLPRPSAGNEILETHRLVGHGQLEPAR